jgi:hypothetical protein
MTTPRLSNEISLGHIIQVLTLIVLAAVGWGVHTTTVSSMQKQMSEDRLDIQRQAAEIRTIDKTTTIVITKLEGISSTLQEVKAELKKVP